MKKIYEKVRIAVVAICILAAVLKLMHLPSGPFLLIIGMGALTIIHFIYAFVKQETTRKEILIHYISNFSVALITMGILFYLMHWSNAKLILWSGLILALVCSAISYLMPESENNNQ